MRNKRKLDRMKKQQINVLHHLTLEYELFFSQSGSWMLILCVLFSLSEKMFLSSMHVCIV